MLTNVTDETFNEEVINASADTVVIVDYYSNSCSPCNRLMPKLEKVSEELETGKIVKVDIENNFESTMLHMVRTIPTLVVYKNGVATDVLRGCSQISEEEIKKLIN